MIEIGDKVRLSETILSGNIPFPERCYGLMLVIGQKDDWVTCKPFGINLPDYKEYMICIRNVTLVEKAPRWGSPITGNHDPMDYIDSYDGCED